MKEFEMAWEEYFKNKPEPKTEKEDKREQEEFHHWYNYIRKQTDTGKTPVEMYKEEYGREPLEKPTEISRIMNFEWDENYCELDDAKEEATVFADKIFSNSWEMITQEIDGLNRKEACRYSFILGFLNYMKVMDEKAEIFEKELENMSEEDMRKFINNFKDYGEEKKDGRNL
jgi:hypothetical protein